MARVTALNMVNNSVRQTIQQFLKALFEKKLIEGCLVPLQVPNRSNVVQTLITDPKKLEFADPFAPIMPVNSARIMQRMTKIGPSQHKIALVMRPCEIRAMVELTKLKQVHLDNLLVIGMDCYGAFSLDNYQKFAAEHTQPGDDFLSMASNGNLPDELRWNCQVCQYPTPFYNDLTIGLVGNLDGQKLNLISSTDAGTQILEKLDYSSEEVPKTRMDAVKNWIEKRTVKRGEMLESARKAAAGPEKMLEYLSTCIRCLNCMTNCPVCYCRECFFNSSTFELDAEKYFDWAESRGGIRMPNDTLFFHLTRMTHMAASCVACGACTEACPSHIEISRLFTVVGENAQKVFEYVAGRSLDEPLPLSTFKEAELETFDK